MPYTSSVKLTHAVPTDKLNDACIYADFPYLFSGLGEFKGRSYRIHLRDSAVLYSLTTPHQIPLLRLDQVVAELKHMETLGIIREVDEPTNWCAGMVVVPKANGSI